jgi:hypothetical protein
MLIRGPDPTLIDTKIVYCKDTNRLNSLPEQQFDFLGFTFRPRQSMNRTGNLFVSFSPAVSDKAAGRDHADGPTKRQRSSRFNRPAVTWIFTYLDFYNGRRPHSSLDGTTPDKACFTPLHLRLAA